MNDYNLLNSVGVVAANNVWRIGQAANGSSTTIRYWNGTSWNIVSSVNVAGFSNVLQAISVAWANDTLGADTIGKIVAAGKSVTHTAKRENDNRRGNDGK